MGGGRGRGLLLLGGCRGIRRFGVAEVVVVTFFEVLVSFFLSFFLPFVVGTRLLVLLTLWGLSLARRFIRGMLLRGVVGVG